MSDNHHPSVLEEAEELVDGPRCEDYGSPYDNHTAMAMHVRAYLKRRFGVDLDFDGVDWCVLMTFLKLDRHANKRLRDNLVDCAGYVLNAERVQAEINRREASDV